MPAGAHAMVNRVGFTRAGLVAVAVLSVAAAQQAPVFRAGVDLVTVDATVVDGQGNPIEGLRPDDFELKVDGQPRRVVSLEFVSRARAANTARAVPSAVTTASSNEVVADGRLILVAVDQAHIRRLGGRLALRAAERFIDALGPFDRVAVTAIDYAGDLDFTTDRGEAKRQLSTLTGTALSGLIQPNFNLGLAEALLIGDGNKIRLDIAARRECGTSLGAVNRQAEGRDPCPTQLEQEARMVSQQVRTEAARSVNGLISLLRRLETIDGPKTVALLSEGLVAEPRIMDLTPLGVAAQAARASVYVLQIETPLVDASTDQISPTLTEDAGIRTDGLTWLAGVTGGAFFRLAGSNPAPFTRILRELSGYYLLAFEAVDSDRDGRPHRIALSVRTNATVRFREGFRFDPAASAASARARRIEDLLRSPAVASELPLRAATYSFFDPEAGKVHVTIGGEAGSGGDEPAGVLLGYVLLDAKGTVVASQAWEAPAPRFATTVTVDAGVYTLKVAAIDRLGRAGSVPRAVLAGISDSALPTSELLIARVPANPNASLEPILDATRDSRVVAYLELYPDAGRSLSAVDVTLTVRPADGSQPLLRMPAAISTRGDRHAVARAVLSTERLLPGRYVVRAEVTDAGRSLGFAERTFRVER